MQHARVFQSGNSQAVRLPKEFRLDVDQVEIFRRGDEIVLRPMPESAVLIFDALADLPADFMADGRDDTPPQAIFHPHLRQSSLSNCQQFAVRMKNYHMHDEPCSVVEGNLWLVRIGVKLAQT